MDSTANRVERSPNPVTPTDTNRVQGHPAKKSLHTGLVLLPRYAPRIGSLFSLLAWLALAWLIQLFIFPPNGWALLAYVCLVPWLLAVVTVRSAHGVYWGSLLYAVATLAVNLSWVRLVTVEGYVALVLYLAIYYPLMACALRHLRRHWRIPLALTAPVIWVAGEIVRATGILGFPWLLLAHTQFRILPLIQISDLVGAYGVSFVVAAVNGLLADLFLVRWTGQGYRDWNFLFGSLAPTTLGLVATLAYGFYRLGQNTTSPGPRVAVIQRDYPLLIDGQEPPYWEKAQAYFDYIAQLEDQDVDVVLLPETPWYMYLNDEFLNLDPADPGIRPLDAGYIHAGREYDQAFRELAARKNASVVVGAVYRKETPLDLRAAWITHNSAFVYSPGGNDVDRYDKVHCVLFGEVVPFRYSRLHWLYLWLNDLSPFGRGGYEYSISPGTEFRVFELKAATQNSRVYRFGVPICYEDVMPYVARAFVSPDGHRKSADFLLNISNDGWFLHSNELTQHLVASVFRAVENRVGIARSVNTGISGFIDPDGRVHDLVEKDGVAQGPGIEGWRIAHVMVDSRHSLYSKTGDGFGFACAALGGLAFLDYLRLRARHSRHRLLDPPSN